MYWKSCPGCGQGAKGKMLSRKTIERIDRIEWAIRRITGWSGDTELITGYILRRRNDKKRVKKLSKPSKRN